MKKRSRFIAIALVLSLVLGTAAMAASGKNVLIFPGVNITVDGQDATPTDKEVFLYNDTTYVPLRFLAELFGLNVGWDADTNTVLLGKQPAVYTPGTYTGTAMGFGGPVTVEVTVTEKAITAAKVTGADETPEVGGAVLGRLGNLAKNQGLEMDAVTGATYTSRGVKDALGVALAKAEGKTVGTPADGKYTVEAIGHEGIIVVTTMFKDGKIKSVTIDAQNETEGVGTYAIDRMPGKFAAAQSFNVDAVGGATVSSTTIKQGVVEAIIAAGGDPAAFSAAPEKAEVVPTEVTEDVDVVIAGAGTAGLLAAARLLEAGVKNVLIFEKQDIPGGSMPTAFGGFNGVDSQTYQNWLVGREVNMANGLYMSSWENIGDALGKAYGKGKDTLPWLQQMYQTSGKLYDWMNSIGVGFMSLGVEPGLVGSPYFAPGCYSGGCGYLMEFMVDRITAQGGRIIYNTPVTELLQDENGAITGVKAVGEDGKTWTVNAKQTMLATGSFAKNEELLEQYHPEWADENFICPESLTGDGLVMGLNAGGVVDYAGAYMPGFLATYNSHFELAFLHYMNVGLMVNIKGDQFGNIMKNNHAMMAEAKANPANGNTFYYIFDDAGAATIKDYDAKKFTYKAIFEKGEAVHYDSVEEASEALNLPNLAQTIATNNELAMNGGVSEWGQGNLPYIDTRDGIWLVRVEPVVYLTTAGLRVDIDGHLLTENDEVIPNLWAAGDVIGSYEQRETRYGNGFDAAVTFGAIVGDNIAAELQK